MSIFAFRFIPSGFFPDSTTPLFYVNYWLPEGSDIRRMKKDMMEISQHIQSIDQVENVTTIIGKGMPRFMLVYTPESDNPSYGQFVVRVADYKSIDDIAPKVKSWILNQYPNSEAQIQKVRLGPGKTSKIEVRFSGPSPSMLRSLSGQAQAIMRQNPEAIDIRDDWRQKVKVISPVYNELKGRKTGISREQLSLALDTAFSGVEVGLYREKDELIPIISRAPENERLKAQSILELTVWSQLLQRNISVDQLVDNIEVTWQDNIVANRNRLRTITVKCDPNEIEASQLFNQLKPKIESIPLPPGYQLEWGGEYEDSKDAQEGLAKNIPGGLIAMIAIVILLFNSLKQPLVIWLCVPLAFIGVSFGLLLTYKPFDFMAILGFLSLTGMLIKNAIVLIDQIDLEIHSGKERRRAIIDSSVSRLRPVTLAALTTVLGLAPLLTDVFFVSMAVVIMFGLSFATLLTLVIVPVLYDKIVK